MTTLLCRRFNSTRKQHVVCRPSVPSRVHRKPSSYKGVLSTTTRHCFMHKLTIEARRMYSSTPDSTAQRSWIYHNVTRPWRRWVATSMPAHLSLADIVIRTKHYEEPPPSLVLWDHKSPDCVNNYVLMTDQDIGGYSHASLSYHEEGHLLFEGYIDLRLSEEQIEAGIQQSGYAAFQTKELTKYLNLEYWDSLHMRIRTDDRIYVAQIKLDNAALDLDIYQCIIPKATEQEVGQWREVVLPWSDFVLTYRGYVEDTHTKLLPRCISHFGILSAQRKDGPFKFELGTVSAINKARKSPRYTII